MRAKLAAFVFLAWCLLFPARSRAGSWHLMQAPSRASLDASCRPSGSPAWLDHLAALRYWEPASEAWLLRCLRESLIDVPGAPLSRWVTMEGPAPGDSGPRISPFTSLEECEAVRHSGLAKPLVPEALPPGWKTEVYMLFTYDYQPSLRGKVYIPDKSRARRALENFEREHRNDDRALTYAAFLRTSLQNPWRRRPSACVASDDPRLAKPMAAPAEPYWPAWLSPLMRTPYVADGGMGR